MKNSKNKRTSILVIILVGLLVVAYKVMFVSPSSDVVISENISASIRVETILKQVESINFNLDIIKEPKFQSLKSIEIPLVSLPVGKSNPFSSVLNFNK